MPKPPFFVVPLSCPYCFYDTPATLKELKKINQHTCLVCGKVSVFSPEMKRTIKESYKDIQEMKKKK